MCAVLCMVHVHVCILFLCAVRVCIHTQALCVLDFFYEEVMQFVITSNDNNVDIIPNGELIYHVLLYRMLQTIITVDIIIGLHSSSFVVFCDLFYLANLNVDHHRILLGQTLLRHSLLIAVIMCSF